MTVKSFNCGKRPNIVPNQAECVLAGDLDRIQQAAQAFSADKPYPISVEAADNGVLVSACGLASHGSMPEDGYSAGMSLVMFLSSLPLAGGTVKEIISFLAATVGMNT